MKKINKLALVISIPAFILYKGSRERNKIDEDINAWIEQNFPDCKNLSVFLKLHILLFEVKEFRNLFYMRIGRGKILKKILKTFIYAPMDSLYLNTESSKIGGGLYIQHGFSTIVIAKSIGKNCWINQQVTIGWIDGRGCPEIGNNVHIYSGAVVVGNIKIGNNVVIGANTTVTKDVADNCTVVGSHALIIERNGKKVKELL
ncbi:serine O-acetyltransferase [Sporolactobacillus sp. KGMB 08714]|uniref:serine O-acetyltransferase n=1 Tax=Sporolactobacillus sp. KGMB 08714 TaxID=3064704 RepID=UPI002FBE79F3